MSLLIIVMIGLISYIHHFQLFQNKDHFTLKRQSVILNLLIKYFEKTNTNNEKTDKFSPINCR